MASAMVAMPALRAAPRILTVSARRAGPSCGIADSTASISARMFGAKIASGDAISAGTATAGRPGATRRTASGSETCAAKTGRSAVDDTDGVVAHRGHGKRAARGVVLQEPEDAVGAGEAGLLAQAVRRNLAPGKRRRRDHAIIAE